MPHDPAPPSRRTLLAAAGAAAGAAFLPKVLAETASKAPSAGASLGFEPLPLRLRHTWTIARGSADDKKNGLLTLTADGVTGYGEAAPNKRWNQTYDTCAAAFERVRKAVAGLSPWEHLGWIERAEKEAGNEGTVTAALDMALWDWKGKKLGVPVWKLLGVSPSAMPISTFSIGIDTAEVMKEKTREAAAYPRLKVKLGLENDEANVAAIRSVTDKPLTFDANEGWKSVEELKAKISWLNELKPLYLEQPMPSSMDAEMAKVKGLARFPILTDESVLHPSDIPRVAALFDGVVVKLAKCGGITRGYEEVGFCRALGLKTMLGCMIESSIGIAAGVALGPLFDWLDLDGNLLLANDPFKGLTMTNGVWQLPDRPGLGVSKA